MGNHARALTALIAIKILLIQDVLMVLGLLPDAHVSTLASIGAHLLWGIEYAFWWVMV
jgi:hypothetical protein